MKRFIQSAFPLILSKKVVEFMQKEDELCSINGIGEKKAYYLKRAGFNSLSAIANATKDDLSCIKGFSDISANQLIIRAKALQEQKIIPIKPNHKFPPRDRLILIDIETDIYASYVWAICAVLPDGRVKQWYAPTKKETKHIIDEFNKWLQKILTIFHRPVLGSWNNFDFTVLRKVHKEIIATFDQFHIIDCLKEVRCCYAFPISSMGLKDVSAYLGYKYDEKDIDGLLAASLYMQFQRRGGMSKELEKKLLQYNIDDVLAMWFVLDETFYNKSEKG